jgi:hypothetical protein
MQYLRLVADTMSPLRHRTSWPSCSGMVREILLTALILILLPGCASLTTAYPELDTAKKQSAVVVGYFESGYELPDAPECNKLIGSTLTICDPVLTLTVQVTEQIVGIPLPRRIKAFSTSHWGLLSFKQFGPDFPHVIKIETDGHAYVIPPYQFRALAFVRGGDLAMPKEAPDNVIRWLRCEVSQNAERLDFVRPKSVVSRRLGEDAGMDLGAAGDYLKVKGDNVRVARGVKLESIRGALRASSDSLAEQSCDR